MELKMPENKTIQKGWRFTPETIAQLEEICKKEIRSEQNMVEVLINREFERIQRLKRVTPLEDRR